MGRWFLFLGVLSAIGCESQRATMSMSVVPVPEGGAVTTVTTVTTGGTATLVAPTDHAIFVRSLGPWEAIEAQLLPSYRVAPLALLRFDEGEFTFPRNRAFVGMGDRLFMVTHSVASTRYRLWVSDDTGRTWSLMASPKSDAGSLASDPIRLLVDGGVLYAVQGRSIWRLQGSNIWTPVSLEGIVFESELQPVPSVIRNYLPASKDRPFELVSVLSDQLRIYRRAPEQAWMLTSVLGAVDRQLVGVPKSKTLLLITSDSVMRSDDEGEQWMTYWPHGGPRIEVVEVFEAGETVILVGGVDGSIWRSFTHGAGWEQVSPPDPDGRAVTGLQEVEGAIVASTLGRGMLRSSDAGRTWTEWNQGLRAAHPLDCDVTDGGDLLFATEAGLFRSTADPRSGEWKRVHPRAVGAVADSEDELFSGTFSGEMIATEGPGAPSTQRIASLPVSDAVEISFVPQRHRQTKLPPTAVADVSLDGSSWTVWTRSRGLFVSSDQGATWSVLELSDALTRTLGGATVTRFIAGTDTTYIAEHSDRLGTPTQLWRSKDTGRSWTAVRSFAKSKSGEARVVIKRTSRDDANHLVVGASEGALLSRDGGDSWTPIQGDWTRVVDLAVDDRKLAVLGVSKVGTSELFVAEDFLAAAPLRTFDLSWPEGAADPPKTLEMLLDDRRVFVSTTQGVYFGVLPTGTERYGEGFVAVIAAAVVAFASMIGFGLLRLLGR